MKHKFITFLLLMTAAVALLSFHAGAADAVDEFAEDMRSFQTDINVPVRDFDALMKETFSRYPELYYYYSGCTYRSTADGLEFTMRYQNTDKTEDDFFVVDSYDEMVAAIGLTMCDLEKEVDVILANGFTMTTDEFWSVFDTLEKDFYLIYMGYYSRSYSNWDKQEWGVSLYDVDLNFYYEDTPVETVRYWRDASEQKTLELAGSLFAQDMPDYMKVLLIHDWLVDNNYYDMTDFQKLQWENHCAFGTLAGGNGVCQSYSEAGRMLMAAAGVEAYYVPGDGISSDGSAEAHSWNCVNLGGEWYWLDTTWDDPVTGDGSNVKQYDYFLVTSEQLRTDHSWEEGNYPVCTATALSYETVRAMVDADANTYTDYSTRLVRTQEIQRQELLAMLGETTAQPEVEPEKPVSEPDEPIDEPEEPVDEPAEPVDEPEEPVDEPDEPIDEPGEPADEPDEPADESDDPVQDPDEPEEDQLLPEELQPVIKIDKEKQKVSGSYVLIVGLVVLALCAVVSAVIIHCVAAHRVYTARDERLAQRQRRMANAGRSTRRRF